MKNAKKLIGAALISVFAVSAAGCNMISKTPAAIKASPVAKVNDEYITRSDFDLRMNSIIAQMKSQGIDVTSASGKQQVAQERTTLLDQMVTETLELQEAKKLKIYSDTKQLQKDVDTDYNKAKAEYSSETEFKQQLATYGYTEAQFKDLIRINKIITKLQEQVTKNITVTDDEMKTYYAANQYKYTTQTDTMHVKHILVKTEAEAEQVKARLDKGEDFATVAKEVSIDTGSASSGGDLGDIQYTDSNYDADFMKGALTAKLNVPTKPVKSQYGYHIILVTKRTEYPVKSYDTVKADIKSTLLSSKQQTAFSNQLSKWKKAAKIDTKSYAKNLTS